ncbi:uncharacterized protein LOC110022682 [Phalaenopsis equestris]|uniref:uncharacterized protein LOC110022682 n=1 Tax=Phalaenopsis equestris TaxID=78828 RepID=UPI0009E1EBA1|nr:uncharacterized protein LOC110022682 [Phalaenopsis equestris]
MTTASASILRPLLLTLPPSPRRLHLDSRFLSPTLRQSPLSLRPKSASSSSTRRQGVVKAAQSSFIKVIQAAWRIGRETVESGTNLVPDSIPRPIAKIVVSGALAALALFLFNSILSTAFFVLALMGVIYFIYIALNKDEGPKGGGGDPLSAEESLEEARRIMEKYNRSPVSLLHLLNHDESLGSSRLPL